MAINRFSLIEAISEARKHKDDKVYDELLSIYYRLLEQEEINDNFIINFITHNQISESAKETLSKCLIAAHS